MSGWISSKLRVAETFLQQIDQQAAESLGKNEKTQSDELNDKTPARTGEVVPLKDQLKKKTPDNNDLYGYSRSDSNSDRNQDKQFGTPLKTSPKSTPTLTDSDWTELLSTPKQPPASDVNRTNGISAIRGPRKDGRKQGNSSSYSLSSEGKKNHNRPTVVFKSTRRSDTEPGYKLNGGVASPDGRQIDSEDSGFSDSTQAKSSSESQNGDHYVEGRERGANLLLEPKGDASQDSKYVLETAGDGKLSLSENYNEKKGGVGNDAFQPAVGKHAAEIVPVSGTIDDIVDIKRQPDGDHDASSSAAGRIDKSNAAVGNSVTHDLQRHSSSLSDEESDSDTDSASTSDSENERERRAEKARQRERIMAERAAAKAIEAIKERENIVARLEGEKQSLEKILEERARQQAQEASELQMSMIETMEAVDLEKQKHNSTRMEALERLAKIETANLDLARSLASTQRNLDLGVDHVVALRRQIELKEAEQEDLKRRFFKVHQSEISSNQSEASKGVEFEREILEAEYTFVCDKVGQLQEKAQKLEENIETTHKEIENSTEVEIELKRRLGQLTDHLIQKQAQVESLSSEKAMLLFRIETVSRMLDENKSAMPLADLAGPSASDDLEAGMWHTSNSKLKPLLEARIRSGGEHFGSLLRQLDAIFSAGAAFIRRNPAAKLWSLIYLVCLHFWVVYILMSHSQPSDDSKSGAIISLENINKTGSI
ncbi:golgin candidate 2-like isoform X1 [Telopea speciosissima]|uniref:golgin candidate 2-like isoform X1 n=1 Tax=Telopea speciosissima TaxID=54955 RepID=UPI001CC5FA6D|nr:golgin candidate 2-like isoform X1 [Telopea speciosissima]